ncbi:MAG: hypothetical protein K2J95_13460 [Lachnospiraceae bacterium]|nr:hypothetical protein [Lachnospiraceae bacterium]
MKKLNNKGVALVTVLITMTFATILATSLIYMAYMNYVMKSMRFSSTDNFYTAEFALDDLAMAMQQLAAEQGNAADAVAALRTSVGENYGNGVQQYDNEHVRAMIQVASREASISVNTIYEQNENGSTVQNLYTTSNSVELKGLEITSVTASGYKSTIVTDLKIVFPSSNLGDLDINDFSVLSDSPVIVDAGNCYFTGCVFIGDGTPGTVGDALTVKGSSIVHILSPRGVINGNIEVKSGSTLVITGTVSVVGNIHLESGATLVCTEALKVQGSISGPGRADVRGVDNLNKIENQTMDVTAIPDDLLAQLIVPVWMYYFDDWHRVELTDLVGAGTTWNRADGKVYENGIEVAHVWFGLEGTMNGAVHNLILSPEPVRIIDDMADSTIIANQPITIGQESTYKSTIMQRLSDEDYERAKSAFLGVLNRAYAEGGNISFPTGKAPDDIPGSPAHTYQATIDAAPNYPYDVDYVCHNSLNYVTVGNFINERSSEIITEMMGKLQGDTAASTSVISIYNWSKE